MKSTILLFAILMCLLVGTLARPDAPLDENDAMSLEEGGIAKRSAESSSQENDNDGSYAAVTASLKNISKKVSELLGQIGKMSGVPVVKDLISSLPEMFRGDISLEEVTEIFSTKNVDKFLKQLNPLNEMLINIPLIADAYESVLKMIATPLAIVASILASMSTMFGKAMATITSITPPLLS